jgi:hypothetical protein
MVLNHKGDNKGNLSGSVVVFISASSVRVCWEVSGDRGELWQLRFGSEQGDLQSGFFGLESPAFPSAILCFDLEAMHLMVRPFPGRCLADGLGDDGEGTHSPNQAHLVRCSICSLKPC